MKLQIVLLALTATMLFSCNQGSKKETNQSETSVPKEEAKQKVSEVMTAERQAILLPDQVLQRFIDGNTIPFLLTIIILFSPAFIGTFDLIRSEILSIIFCFLYYIFLEKSLKNKINLIISGSCLSLAMLAKVQVIFSIFGFLLIFFLIILTKEIQ